MLHIKVLQARNLPFTKKSKILLNVVGVSSVNYEIGSKTAPFNDVNPIIDFTLDIPLDRVSSIIFYLSTTSFLSKPVFLDKGTLDIPLLFQTNIITLPTIDPVQYQLQLSSENEHSSCIFLEISTTIYYPPQIQLYPLSNFQFNAHLSYKPPIAFDRPDTPVEIGLVVFHIEDPNNNVVRFYDSDKCMTEYGGRTYKNFIIGTTGPSQLITFQGSLFKSLNKYCCFVLKVHDYQGSVTLNITGNKEGFKSSFHDDLICFDASSLLKSYQIFSFEIHVEPNHIYLIPYRLNFQQPKSIQFDPIGPVITDERNPQFLKIFSDAIAKSVHLGSHGPISIIPILGIDEKVKISNDEFIFIESTSNKSSPKRHVLVFDKETGARCSNIEQSFALMNNNEAINLNTFQPSHIIFFCISSSDIPNFGEGCSLKVSQANPPKLLFHNFLASNISATKAASCFMLKKIDNNWYIISMVKYFKSYSNLVSFVENFFQNEEMNHQVDNVNSELPNENLENPVANEEEANPESDLNVRNDSSEH